MPLGVSRPIPPVSAGDSAEVYSALRVDGQPVDPEQIAQVAFTVQKPDGTKTTEYGIVQPDGQGFLRWFDTTEVGIYLVQAQYTLVSGEIRSDTLTFSVVDPFADNPIPTETELITGDVWMMLEDLFDSINGGPWLKEQTLYNFDENKIARFIPKALLVINTEMPPTQFTIDLFTQWSVTPGDNPNQPLLSQGVLVETIRHLMRSYVEQPSPQGAQVVWHDRTRYTQMWTQIYQLEQADFQRHLILWKRTTLNLGRSALSVYSKAGRLMPYTNQSARGTFRGYY